MKIFLQAGILSFFLFFMLSFSTAQTTISGKVVDEKGEGIPGANISISDSYDGTSSAADGTFLFRSDEKGSKTLISTFIGYKNFQQAVELTGVPVVLSITLREEINQLDAVTISAGSFTAGDEKRRTILKAIDIATTAGATADIAGALNTLPGTSKNGESGRLFVRGGDSNETRTFIDGMVSWMLTDQQLRILLRGEDSFLSCSKVQASAQADTLPNMVRRCRLHLFSTQKTRQR